MALVLIVEDEPALLDGLCEVVEGLGHESARASDGLEALNIAVNRRPSLILSDYMLPGCTGIELIRSLRVQHALAQIPVVLMSAARPRASDEAWRFLQKPLNLADIERTVVEGLTTSERSQSNPRPGAPPANVSPVTLAREDMLNWVAHEIKSPLSTALMNAHLLKREQDGADDSQPSARRLDAIIRQLYRMDELVTSILDAARLDEGRLVLTLEPHSLGAVIAPWLAAFREVHTDIELSFEEPKAPVLARIDAQRFRQIVDNLLSNAVKYGVPPKRLTVEVRAENGEGLVAVRDFGRGIPAAELPRVFDRFHRVEGTGGRGHGLGLYICAALARLHGGRISVESTLGKGSTFTIHLPLAPEPA